jgi:hypothetical protein
VTRPQTALGIPLATYLTSYSEHLFGATVHIVVILSDDSAGRAKAIIASNASLLATQFGHVQLEVKRCIHSCDIDTDE